MKSCLVVPDQDQGSMGKGCKFSTNVSADKVVGVLTGTWSPNKVENGFSVLLSEGGCNNWLDCQPHSLFNPCVFINHHCTTPNVRFEKVLIDGFHFLLVVTSKACEAQEWVSVNYDSKKAYFESEECACSSCSSGSGTSTIMDSIEAHGPFHI